MISKLDFNQLIGRDLGNVTILKELGRGSMGAVFVGFQKSLKRTVAVKILPKADSVDDMSKRLFRDEAEIVAILSHPNIIPIFEMGETDKLFFQVMQIVKGSDLAKILKNKAKHPVPQKKILLPEDTIELIIQVLGALSYAHEEGIVHQDIKPANILIDERTRRPLVSDFGIAKTAQDEYRTHGVILGTPVYMSPEQVMDTGTDGRTDIYAVGIMLYKMMAVNLPFMAKDIKQLIAIKRNDPDRLFAMRPSESTTMINSDLEGIILKSIASKPEERYQTCEDFIYDLENFRDKYLSDKKPLSKSL